ncbi:MAG TPA: TetR/AcrR family transcriptional regulator [Chitinophaga sp.]|uniref:TetR/AcrR family transcriptional regulator n=1 Tax=Chitinophaga sp. TaxID=1869181 RepID=UPI002BF7265C|nr:TetR/AcrR family transcriptional regulator [Chitinophaga sp.]HVI45788.1 TetR/AcrR family transcriptional regulator [Chitinophaga sp.]
MGSKERIAREKAEVREKILEAALKIIIAEGCLALSMRKIADQIEYAPATIYEYFANKDTILIELMGQGYTLLGNAIKRAASGHTTPHHKLEAMWQAYWNFAFRHTELYKLMHSIQVSCPTPEGEAKNVHLPRALFMEVMTEMIPPSASAAGIAENKYYAMWASVHGLISINIVNEKLSKDKNNRIMRDTISAIVNSKYAQV